MIHTIYSLRMHKIKMCLYTGSTQKTYKQKINYATLKTCYSRLEMYTINSGVIT